MRGDLFMEGKRSALANLLYHLVRIKKIDKPTLAKTVEVSEETINGWFDGSVAMTEEQEEKANSFIGSTIELSPDFQEMFNRVCEDYIKEKMEERRKAQADRRKAQKEKSQ
jgi:hypothetical protein